jgi:NADH-quinone oxidoreductase subunit M
MLDLDKREWAMMVPLAAVVLWMGVYPESFPGADAQGYRRDRARVAPTKPKGDLQLKLGVGQPAHEEAAHGEAH